MSALIACVARHGARLYRSQHAPLSTTTRAAAVLYGAPRHTLGLPIASSFDDVFGKPSYFSTTARPGKKNPSSRPSRTPRNGRAGGAAGDRRHPSERAAAGDRIASTPTEPQNAHRRRNSKNDWMKQLADNGDYQTLLRAVYDCYAPLYATHPVLVDKESSLLASVGRAAATGELKFQPTQYNDLETQLTEQSAIMLFGQSKQLQLALAVMNHREWIASTVGKVSLADGTQVDLSRDIAPYCYQAMQTHFSLKNHAQAESIYNRAIQQGVTPTAKMTRAYLFSLTAEQQYTKALDLYQQVRDEKKPYDEEFCQKMLYVAHKTHNSEVAMEIVDTMRTRGYKLDGYSYLNAIASLDNQYYLDPEEARSAGAHARRMYAENYHKCMERIADQATNPDKSLTIEAASYQVLELFDEMINVDKLHPDMVMFLPRVMTAAMLVRQYEAVGQCIDFYQHTTKQQMDPVSGRIATNALLVQNDPVAAWELVLSSYEKVFRDSRRSSKKGDAINTLACVAQYLDTRNEPALAKQLLDTLTKQGLLDVALSKNSGECLMRTIGSDWSEPTTPNATVTARSKNVWMKQVADNGDYQTLLRAVYDCYAPFSNSRTKLQPAEYDHFGTQIMEQLAIMLLTMSNQLELALAVMNHREWIASTVGKVSLADGTQVDLSHHIAPYCYQAMRTHFSLKNHAQVESIYNRAIEQGLVPTAKMTRAYLFSLAAEQQFTKALELYQQVRDEKKPYDEEFCQKMLYVAHKTYNSEVAMEIVDTMRTRGYKLDGYSYLNAIASFQEEYFFSPEEDRYAGVAARRRLYAEDYHKCMERIAEQATNRDKYASIEAASAQVLKLFEEMVRAKAFDPHKHEYLLTQVMTAAMLLHQYGNIASYTAQYRDALMKQMDPLAVRIATNALLVQHQPVAAWELVLAMYAKVFDDSLAPGKELHLATSTLAYVVEYLKANKQTAHLMKLLALLNEQGRLESALCDYSRKCAMGTLMSDPADINDDAMWQLVAVDYAPIFPVLTDSEWLMMFLAFCAYTGRWSLVSRAIQSRDKTKMAQIVPQLASFGNDQVLTSGKPYPPYLELVAQLPDLVAVSEEDPLSDADKITLACNAIHALDALQQQQQQRIGDGDGVGNGSEIENQSHRDWKLDILRLHDQYLSGATTIDAIPTQVQEIVKQAQLE